MSKWHTTEFCENCAKEFCCTDECKYHLLHRIRQARDEIYNLVETDPFTSKTQIEIEFNTKVLAILDELIESEE